MNPFRPTIPQIRIIGFVGRNGCIALQLYFTDVAQHATTNGYVHFGDNKTSTHNINGYIPDWYYVP